MATIKRYSEIMQTAMANMIARQDKITDFNEGSIAHTFCDTVARLMERGYVAIRQGYNEQLKILPYSIFGLTKKSGTYAGGMVVFSRSSALTSDTVIASGTKISGGGYSFTTTASATIAAGETTSDEVTATADEAGSGGNVEAGVISSIDSVVSSDVVAVTNTSAFTGGCDEETDTEFYLRFQSYINGLSGTNSYAVKAAALSVDGVKNAELLVHTPPAEDIYNFTVYIDDGSGSATDDLIEAVTEAIEGDGTQTNPGHVCPGINFRVLAPSTTTVDVELTVTLAEGANQDDAEAEITTIITELVNSKTIGESVLRSEIISALMDEVYVLDVEVTSPAANVEADTTQVLRLGTLTLNFEQES